MEIIFYNRSQVDDSEFEGMQVKTLDELLSKGYTVRYYIPYGPDWYPYSIRRIRENPDIAFYKVNREPINNDCKVNRQQPQLRGHKNLVYITYDDLQKNIDKRWYDGNRLLARK